MTRYFAKITAVGTETREPDHYNSFEAIIYRDSRLHRPIGEVTVTPGRDDSNQRIIRHFDDRILRHWHAIDNRDRFFARPDTTYCAILAAVDCAGHEQIVIDALTNRTVMCPHQVARRGSLNCSMPHAAERARNPDPHARAIMGAFGRLIGRGRLVEHGHCDGGHPSWSLSK